MRIAVKDNICMKHTTTQAASLVLKGYKSPIQSTIVDLLYKYNTKNDFKHVNMDEFGMGSMGIHSMYGLALLNGRVCGGSSSGSAQSVALKECELGIGTDTGGSIRLPAAFCKIYGFKPSYGRVSRYGVIPYAQSLDTVGLLANTMDILTAAFKVLDKYDEKDATSLPIQYRQDTVVNKDKLIIGLPSHIKDPLFIQQIQLLKKNNKIEFINVDLKLFKYHLACYYIIACAEASSSLNRYTGLLYPPTSNPNKLDFEELRLLNRQLFGNEVKSRLALGDFVLSSKEYGEWFLQATRTRRLIKNEFDSIFKSVDYLLMPTTLQDPPLLSDIIEDASIYNTDEFTVGISLSGNPCLSFPTSTISMQLIGNYLSDYQLLNDFNTINT